MAVKNTATTAEYTPATTKLGGRAWNGLKKCHTQTYKRAFPCTLNSTKTQKYLFYPNIHFESGGVRVGKSLRTKEVSDAQEQCWLLRFHDITNSDLAWYWFWLGEITCFSVLCRGVGALYWMDMDVFLFNCLCVFLSFCLWMFLSCY